MITLYQLHWSHYVEKARWALDFKRVEWKPVDVDPFTKREMRHLQSRTTLDSGKRIHTVPTISDDATGAVVAGSSEILLYLERTYPDPPLFPSDTHERDQVTRWMLWLDSTLGLAARRLTYTHIALEHPGYLAELFLPHVFAPGSGGSFKARSVGMVLAGVLARRFRFAHNREDGVYDSLAQCLRSAALRLRDRTYLVGERFSAADLTLAALMRPVNAIPYFRELPDLRALFQWRSNSILEHGRDAHVGYERALHELREHRGYTLGGPHGLSMLLASAAPTDAPPALVAARNDQQSMGRWPVLSAPWTYFRLKRSCNLTNVRYPLAR